MHKYGKDSRSRNPRSYLPAFLLCQNILHTLCIKLVIIVPSLALDGSQMRKDAKNLRKINQIVCFPKQLTYPRVTAAAVRLDSDHLREGLVLAIE